MDLFDDDECTGELEELESLSLLLENMLTRFFTEGSFARTWSFKGRLFGRSESDSKEEDLLLVASEGVAVLTSEPIMVGLELRLVSLCSDPLETTVKLILVSSTRGAVTSLKPFTAGTVSGSNGSVEDGG